MTLDPCFHFLEVAYPYMARRLLTDENPALRDRLIQVLFKVISNMNQNIIYKIKR